MNELIEQPTNELRIDRDLTSVEAKAASLHAVNMVALMQKELPPGRRIERVVLSLSVFLEAVGDQPTPPSGGTR